MGQVSCAQRLRKFDEKEPSGLDNVASFYIPVAAQFTSNFAVFKAFRPLSVARRLKIRTQTKVATPSSGATAAAPGLKRDYLSFWEVAAQSVANIAPVATPTLIIPLVFASGGNGTWLAYLLATLAMLLMAFEINQFARRSASSLSQYAFVFKGLGPTAGVISGWSLVIAYIFTGGAVLAGGANYVMVLGHLALSARHDTQVALGGM